VDIFTSSEFLKACNDFLASFERDDKSALSTDLMEQFMLHDNSPMENERVKLRQVPASVWKVKRCQPQ
jgi:hypothetical protein